MDNSGIKARYYNMILPLLLTAVPEKRLSNFKLHNNNNIIIITIIKEPNPAENKQILIFDKSRRNRGENYNYYSTYSFIISHASLNQ